MSDLFMRDDAPLTKAEWERLDKVVVHAARQILVGRRFIELVGPFGAGTEIVPVGAGPNRRQLAMKTIQSDFSLFWRDIEANRRAGLPLELGAAAEAAAHCAKEEDTMVLGELLSAEGRKTVKLLDWETTGNAFENITSAIEALVSDGFFGPYAVIVSPALYAKTQRFGRGMRLESKLITDVADGGLFRSMVLAPDQAMVLSLGAHNLDLAIGQDLITTYMGNEGLDHLFRLMESLVLRIKRPGAICTLEA
ncbi:MAG: encapsulin [Anaerolineae bacterium]|nr:encapsulin [Anaerolineae bacterium]